MIDKLKGWSIDRLKERTTYDGLTLIVVCGATIIFGSIAAKLAWIGLAYGIFTTVKSQAE